MSSAADEMRRTLDALNEAAQPKLTAEGKPVGGKNVMVNINTLSRQIPHRGRYYFNKGFLAFQDIIDNPAEAVQLYRKNKAVDTVALLDVLKGLKPDERFTDKEHYLRLGFEARGFSNDQLYLIWFKDKVESLLIFAKSQDRLVDVRDFLKAMNIIRTS